MTERTLQAKTAMPTLDGVKHDINQLLYEFYLDAIARAKVLHPAYARLWQAMYAAHHAGGKRLRPYMMMLSYKGFGGTDEAVVLPAAASLELLHTCLLVHDDIIDRDYVRHGAPNIAGQYRSMYAANVSDEVQNSHYSDSAALLAGDLLLAGAYRMLHQSALPSIQKLAALELLSQAVFVVAGGELLDTEAAFTAPEQGNSLRIAQLKTAHYSFTTTLQMGALLAGAPASLMDTLARAGDAIGIAFQLADDLLGMFGDSQTTGKSVAGDLLEGKRTYLIERALALTDGADHAMLLAMLGNAEATEADIQATKMILIECGAKSDTQAMMVKCQAEALDLIKSMPCSAEVLAELETLFDTLIWREA
jgi:geranylgeranyl pyrophosphate synthase